MSEQDGVKRRGRPPKVTAVAPRTDEGTWGADDVLAKRLGGQPFGVRVEAIPLKEQGKWQLYIASSDGQASRHYDMVHRKGWTPCTVDDITVSPESIGFKLASDGRTLCRGHRGEEVVYKMPKDKYDALQRMKAAENVKGMRSESAAKQDAAKAAAAALGDEAGEYLSRHGSITIKDTQAPV